MQTLVKKQSAGFYGGHQQSEEAVSKRKSKTHVISALAFIGLFVLTFLFYTWVRVQAVNIGYEMAQIKNMESKYLEINKKLKTEIAMLNSHLSLKAFAQSKLGLGDPNKDQIIIFR